METTNISPENRNRKFLKSINLFLFIILLLMIAGFFTWSENIIITRIIKVAGRTGVMFSSVFIYYRITCYGGAGSLGYKNILPPAFYIGYLTLGAISFAWNSNPGFSALQWLMVLQSFVFAYFFIKSLKTLDIYFEGHQIWLYNLLGNAVFVIYTVFVTGMWADPDTFFRLTNGGEKAQLGGIIMNPNELGMLAGAGIACLIFDLYRKKNKLWIIIKIAVIFYALLMTGSHSSLMED
ncbi:MAG: hypothetical protein MUW56_22205 [Chryseobacterium sp.]|uniref:hypothetical protein n=1 Tax=Chryseobacterium sp. TaxID=1871047 RepID=UPI0025C23D07|nr:hypothetical protein [Chryseobacterium sp.]MCJ7936268.1 hypothetical protein [Chryseobacterium sp.]